MGNIELQVGYATMGQGAGPLLVTESAGLFLAHGLHVTTRLMGGAKGVVKGLMSGEIAFGNLAAPALLKANLRGDDVVFLTGGINQQFLMGSPGIETRAQLAGRSLGLLGDGGLNDLLIRFIREQLERESVPEVSIVPVASGDKIETLRSGKCDALVITPPEAISAQRQGCRYLVDFGEYGLNFALGGIAARKRTIEEQPGVVEAFVEAYAEGMQRYKSDRAFTIEVQQSYSQLTDPTIAEETYNLTAPGMPDIPVPRLEAFAVALSVLSHEIPEAAGADPRRFVDSRFIEKVAARARGLRRSGPDSRS